MKWAESVKKIILGCNKNWNNKKWMIDYISEYN